MPKKNESIINSKDLLKSASTYLNKDEIIKLKNTIDFATNAHKDQKRLSGVNYISHPLAVAYFITELKLDLEAIQAALLHDTLEDCGIEASELMEVFGKNVCHIVQAVTKIDELQSTQVDHSLAESETMKKMFLAMAEDVRVVIIKIADRLHNMQTLQFLSKKRQLAISTETMEVFAPLADRLGIWQYKWQLEDLAFSYLESAIYNKINSMIATSQVERINYVDDIVSAINKEFESHNFEVEIHGRVKNVYSIYKKMERYSKEGKNISKLYDLFAIRIIVKNIADCYSAVGVVHQAWRPIPGSFDDYIANSKDSLYQSIHTNVIGPDNKPLEVQIRTAEMHERAEIGVAAHWKYKDQEFKNIDSRFESRLVWLRNILDRQRESSNTDEFVTSIKHDLFKDQIFVYTPNSDLKMLPIGATPVDFAFSVHTDLGFHCKGAKINGTPVSLKYKLQNGDIVEIILANDKKGPPRHWLNDSEGYLGSDQSKQKVKQWFRKFEKEYNIKKGKELLFFELSRLNISKLPKGFTKLMGYKNLNDLYAAIGYGDVSNEKLVHRIFDHSKELVLFSSGITMKLIVADRVGILRDISTVIASSDVNMVDVKTEERDDNMTNIFVTLDIKGGKEFAKLFYDLDVIKDVIELERITQEV
jgi:GTP pyrophosphokinase